MSYGALQAQTPQQRLEARAGDWLRASQKAPKVRLRRENGSDLLKNPADDLSVALQPRSGRRDVRACRVLRFGVSGLGV